MVRAATPLSALALLGASLALAACGSSGSGSAGGSTGASASASAAPAQGAAFQRFQSCLKANGVTLPARGRRSGGPGGAGARRFGDPKFRKALQACAKYRPQGRFGGPNGGRPRFDIKAFMPYLTCLKAQGLDVKVADGFNALRGLRRDDPKVQAALRACQARIPRPGAGGSTTTSTTGAT